MPRYNVPLLMKVYQTATVQVEAQDEADAIIQALSVEQPGWTVDNDFVTVDADGIEEVP